MKYALTVDAYPNLNTGTWCVKRGYAFLNLFCLLIAVAFSAGGGNSPAFSTGTFVYIKAAFLLLPILSAFFLFLSKPAATFRVIKKITAENKYFVFYLAAALFSIPLAVDWVYSLNRLAYTLLGTLSVLSVTLQYGVLFTRDYRISVLKRHLICIICFALAGFAGVLCYQTPDTLVPGVRNAISAFRIIHPNILAAFFAHLLVWQMAWLYLGQKKTDIAGIFLALCLFVAISLLFSRSAFIALFLCLVVTPILSFLWYQKKTALLAMLSCLCIMSCVVVSMLAGDILTTDGVLGIFTRGNTVESLYTLTNRTELWRILFEDVGIKQFFLGHGYSVINPDFGVDFGTGILYGAHNAYLAIFLGCGIFGLMFYMLFLVSGFISAMRIRHSMPPALIMALIGSYVLLAVNSLSTEEIGVSTTLTFAYVLLIKSFSAVFYAENRVNQ